MKRRSILGMFLVTAIFATIGYFSVIPAQLQKNSLVETGEKAAAGFTGFQWGLSNGTDYPVANYNVR